MRTISKGDTTITPALIIGPESRTESQNVIHQLIGGGIAVSLADDNPRTGFLQLYFGSREDAFAAHALHATAGVFVLVDDDLPELSMTYTRGGTMTIRVDPETLRGWHLIVGFQEVTA